MSSTCWDGSEDFCWYSPATRTFLIHMRCAKYFSSLLILSWDFFWPYQTASSIGLYCVSHLFFVSCLSSSPTRLSYFFGMYQSGESGDLQSQVHNQAHSHSHIKSSWLLTGCQTQKQVEVSGKFLEKFRKEPLGQGQEHSKKRKKSVVCSLKFWNILKFMHSI